MANIFHLSSFERDLSNFLPSETELGRFRHWHVEALLNQASDLLDRCLAEKRIYDDYEAQRESFGLDLSHEENTLIFDEGRRDRELLAAQENIIGYQIERLSHVNPNYQNIRRLLGICVAESEPQQNANNHLYFNYQASSIQNDIAEHNRITEASVLERQKTNAENSRLIEQTRIANRRILFDAKKALSMDGKKLDIDKRIAPMAERIKRDFRDAYSRIAIAYKGMCDFYGFDNDTDHAKIPVLDTEQDGFGPVDSCAIWVRDATRWMVAFSQLDQEWSVTFSLKESLVNEAAWDTRDGDESEFSVVFPLDYFQSHNFARLRGVTAFVSHRIAGVMGPWSVSLQPPQDAISFQGQADPRPLSQSKVPRCHLGRVERVDSPRQPEIGGAVSLRNASPIGNPEGNDSWVVRVMRPHGSNVSVRDLDDVLIELRLAGRPNEVLAR